MDNHGPFATVNVETKGTRKMMTAIETLADVNGSTDGHVELVRSLYWQFLNREPDDEGLRTYAARLDEGLPYDQLIKVFLDSEEWMERQRRMFSEDVASRLNGDGRAASRFPTNYSPPGEAGRSYLHRLHTGFLDRYCSGSLVLDVGYSGYENPDNLVGLPGAIGIDLDYPGYDGRRLPFSDCTVDTVFSSHCLEHIIHDHAAIRDWYRVLKIGGFIVCMVPSQALYEKRRFLPSRFNDDHKRMYTPSTLTRSFEEALEVNSYRVRHLAENDRGFNYGIGPDQHSEGALEIELVVEKIRKPGWDLAD